MSETTKNMTYMAGVYYDSNGASMHYEKYGFNTVKEATGWLHNTLKLFMLNWATIDENGIIVRGEVHDDADDEYTFSDLYELRCGC